MNTVSIQAPASKSLSHRALIAAALAGGVSRLAHVLESDDIARTRGMLTAFGARIERTGQGSFTVAGLGGAPLAQANPGDADPLPLNVGESGTSCRLLTAVAAAGQGRFLISGAGRMHERPIGELTRVLARLGAQVRFENKADCPPLLLEAKGLDASALPEKIVEIGCDESSQYLSGLLLAAPLAAKGLTIALGGNKVVSWPYVSLTLEIMEHFGQAVRVEMLSNNGWIAADWRTLTKARPGEIRFRVGSAPYRAAEYRVEGDWSGASYFLAAGAIGPAPVLVRGLNPNSLQGDAAMLDILKGMGAAIEIDGDGILVKPSRLRGINVDMGHCPDLAPTVAALAAHADGQSVIANAAHLAVKESNRLEAPAAELRKCGCRVEVTADGMVITPPENGPHPPAGGVIFSAHNDHRLAMSTALLGLPGTRGSSGFAVSLDDPACVAKSFPRFWELWQRVTVYR